MIDGQDDFDIFPKGQPIPGGNFNGTTWLQMLVADPTFNCPIGNVSFEPGARNSWHKHPGGQILLVTAGKGIYQERGKPARRLAKGDVVTILPGVEHWHGARPDSRFTHLAITANPQAGEAVWLEPVSDADYAGAAE